MKTKWCAGCEEDVPVDQFYPRRNRKDGLQAKCKTCCNEANRKHHKNNRHASRVKQYFNISIEEYNEVYERFLVQQGGGCAICGKVEEGRRFALDHDHDTGELRGLLCTKCNVGLGMFDDNADLLRLAVNYLNR